MSLSSGGPSIPEPMTREGIRVAYVHVASLCWNFFGYHLQLKAKQTGIRLFDRAVSTAEEQVVEIERVLRENVGVLIFRPMLCDFRPLQEVLLRAQDMGIRLISIDGTPGGELEVCSITADNFGGQAALVDHVCRKLKGRGKLAYFQGDQRTEAGLQRRKGLLSALSRYPNIELACVETFEWASPVFAFPQGVAMTQRVLAEHQDLDAIICANDEGALGVNAALREAGLRGKVHVSGFDGMPEAITALSTGDLDVTARQPLDTMASLALDLATGLVTGEIRTVVHYAQDVDLVTLANVAEASIRALRVFPEVTADLNRRTMEQRNSVAFLEALFDVMPTMVLVKDARDLRYIRANRARDDWLNMPLGSQVGKRVEDFYSPDIAATYNAIDRGVLASGRTLDIPEEEYIRNGSEKRYLRTRKIPLVDDKGHPEFLMVISEDITPQKLTQQALTEHAFELEQTRAALRKNADRLAEAEKMAALGALVAGVSHELNTPIGNALMAVTTYADHTRRITEMAESGLTRSALERYIEDAGRGIELLERNLRRAAELIHSFKQIAADQTRTEARSFSLAAVVGGTVLAVSHTLKRAYRIEQDIPDDLVLCSYPGPLEQVLLNLINNALIHGFEGRERGIIRISARPLSSEQIELKVSDDGRGIAPDLIKRIFDPFFSTKFGQGQSGLGLSLSSNIVSRLLGGQIEVESTPGEGSHFILTIPVQAPDCHDE